MLRFTLLSTLFLCAYGATLPFAPKSGSRIVGGEPATIDEAPHHVAILDTGYNFCGGSIISESIIVSAAECFPKPASSYKIRAGTSYRDTGGEIFDVSHVIIHEEFNEPSAANNDICLIFLTSKLTYGKNVNAVVLPTPESDVVDGSVALIVGWGRIAFEGELPTQLKKVNLPIVNQQLCASVYQSVRPVTNNMICSGNFVNGGQDACEGDAGGSLTVNNELRGIISWGSGCGFPGVPGVSTKVSNYVRWIYSHIM